MAKQALKITRTADISLNDFADELLDEYEDKFEGPLKLELRSSGSTAHGSGTRFIYEIVIRYDSIDPAIRDDIKAIIERASRHADDIQIEGPPC